MQEQLWRKEDEENKAIKIRDLVKNHCLRNFRITDIGANFTIQTERKSEADEGNCHLYQNNGIVP